MIAMHRRFRCSGSGFVTLDALNNGVGDAFPISTGGSFGNVMLILAFLGWDTSPITRLGNDWAGQQILEEFQSQSINTVGVQIDPSISTPVLIQQQQLGKSRDHRFIHRCPSCNAFFPGYTPVKVTAMESFKEVLQDLDVYYFDRPSPGSIRGAQIAKAAGSLVFFEPSSFGNETQLLKAIRASDIVKFSSDRSKDTSAESLCHDVVCIETHGALGLRFRLPQNTGDHEWIWSSSLGNKDLIDTSGAGDWTTAGMIHSLISLVGKRIQINREIFEASLRYGQALAALNCRFAGARGLTKHFGTSEALLHSHILSMGYSFPLTNRSVSSSSMVTVKHLDQICSTCNHQKDLPGMIGESKETPLVSRKNPPN